MAEFTIQVSTGSTHHPLATIEVPGEPDPFDVLVGYLRSIQDAREELPPMMRSFKPPLSVKLEAI